jgi:hypothetical protein
MTDTKRGGLHFHSSETVTPEMSACAETLVNGLLKVCDLMMTISILTTALEVVLSGVLHQETPMPETNITSVGNILENLRAGVMHHASCALHINEKHRIVDGEVLAEKETKH